MVVSYSASLGRDFVSGPFTLANDNFLCFSGWRKLFGTRLIDTILKQVRECLTSLGCVFFRVGINRFSQTKTSMFSTRFVAQLGTLRLIYLLDFVDQTQANFPFLTAFGKCLSRQSICSVAPVIIRSPYRTEVFHNLPWWQRLLIITTCNRS